MKFPEAIYLQKDPEGKISSNRIYGGTWHEDRISDSDVEYVRKDVAEKERQAAIQQTKEACKKAVRKTITDDFKEVYKEDVATWHLSICEKACQRTTEAVERVDVDNATNCLSCDT